MIRAALHSIGLALALSVLVSAWAPATAETQVPVAHETRLAGDEKRTRFIADLSESVEASVFALADPYRVIVDLPEITFQLDSDTGGTGRGLVSAYRFGLFAPGRSRIVLDVEEPVAIDKVFVLDPVDGQPARLVLDLVQTDREAFMRTVSLEMAQRAKSAATREREGERKPAARDGSGKPVIVLDPGHGGLDSGATSRGGVAEKTVVLEFGKLLREKLEAGGRFDVVMTRDDDTFLSLAERVDVARRHRGALFVSIHADSLGGNPFGANADVRGATVYTMSERASDRHAAALAAKENAADLVAGLAVPEDGDDEVSDILFDLTRRETKNFSVLFANKLVEELASAARLNKNPRRAAGFRVLGAPDVPSVLLELGYLSNPHDEKLLTSEEWRERTTDAVVEAINDFFGRRTAQRGS